MSGYFVEQAAKCVVMLMVYEKRDPDAASSSTATRVRLVLNPGQTAGLDSEEGLSLNSPVGGGRRYSSSSESEKSLSGFKTELRRLAANNLAN